jgi:ATP-binding cassette subfamily C protein
MTGAAFDRWNQMRSAALNDQLKSADIGGGYSSITKTLRLFLQSAMLG